MRILFLALTCLCLCLKTYAQLPQVYLTAKKSQALGALSKTASLIVVIENEKSPSDAALIDAVKKYWKTGPVKYMSGLEFSEKLKTQSLDANNLYLYNNYTRELKYTGGAVVTINPSKLANAPAIYSGYYLTNAPNLLINSVKSKKAPPYLYFSSFPLHDKSGNPNEGFYGLMIKNFNHDIVYCQDAGNFTKKKKHKRKKGIYFFTTDSLVNKVILLAKEQTLRQEKKTKDGKVKSSQASAAGQKQKLETDRYVTVKKTVIVFPEDIDYAVDKSDQDIILYNSGSLYSAADGSVYATTRGNASKGGLFNYVSLLLSVGAIVFFVIAIHQ